MVLGQVRAARAPATPPHPDDDAGVLDRAVGVEQAGADGTDLGALRVLDASRRASRSVRRLDVVVHEQQHVAAGVAAAALLIAAQLNGPGCSRRRDPGSLARRSSSAAVSGSTLPLSTSTISKRS